MDALGPQTLLHRKIYLVGKLLQACNEQIKKPRGKAAPLENVRDFSETIIYIARDLQSILSSEIEESEDLTVDDLDYLVRRAQQNIVDATANMRYGLQRLFRRTIVEEREVSIAKLTRYKAELNNFVQANKVAFQKPSVVLAKKIDLLWEIRSGFAHHLAMSVQNWCGNVYYYSDLSDLLVMEIQRTKGVLEELYDLAQHEYLSYPEGDKRQEVYHANLVIASDIENALSIVNEDLTWSHKPYDLSGYNSVFIRTFEERKRYRDYFLELAVKYGEECDGHNVPEAVGTNSIDTPLTPSTSEISDVGSWSQLSTEDTNKSAW